MNNNSIRIDNYLQDEMPPEERAVFEAELLTDSGLRQELEVQQRIMDAAYNAGLKSGFAIAIHKKRMIRRTIRWTLFAVVIVLVILVINFRQDIFSSSLSADQQLSQGDSARFIHPPLAGIDVPFDEYTIDAEKGDTIFTPSGSVICMPPFSMVNEEGSVIKGNVTIRYREFSDPVDFFVSGITMAYDSAGMKYDFESSAMCEITAAQNNKAVFVNPKARPQIFLSASNSDPKHNLYYLDTMKRKWEYIGKDLITKVKDLDRQFSDSTTGNIYTIVAMGDTVKEAAMDFERQPGLLLKPVKASEDKQSFSIEIDPGSFEELMAYNNLKFEVVDESSYKRSDAEEHWDRVDLKKTSEEGIYAVTFTNASRKVSYKVRAVLEGADYAAALKLYNDRMHLYDMEFKKRLRRDASEDSMNNSNALKQKKWTADNEENDRINAMILERNRQMKIKAELQLRELIKREKTYDSINKVRAIAQEKKQPQLQEEMAKLQQEQWLQRELALTKYYEDQRLSQEILRSFTINNFGIWNCDNPKINLTVPIFSKFTDDQDKLLLLNLAAVVYRNFNGLIEFPGPVQIRIAPGQENMVWAISNSSFYYFTYKDFREAGINKDTKLYTFRMRKAQKPVATYWDIKELVQNF